MKITKNTDDTFECICGNDPMLEGFSPCDADGKEVEPTPEEWTSGCYVCHQCGRIINSTTLEVVGQRIGT